MQQRTNDTINKLCSAAWFSNVGVRDTQRAVVLSSWHDALTHLRDLKWTNARIRAANAIRIGVLRVARDRFREWNKIAIDLKATTVPLVSAKVAEIVNIHGLPKHFENAVQWDILHICLEAEYSDVLAPGFYAGQAYWYVNGHLPCGWDGADENGTAIVY